MPRIEVQGADCFYRDDEGKRVTGIRGLNLSIDSGGLLVVLGPSGSGKTTLLRIIAGLESLTHGEIRFDGARVNEISAANRDVGMVFQRPALFPHLTVRANLALGLALRRTRSELIRDSVQSVAERLRLKGLLDRHPGQLSGGEQQRVALGRAIIRQPRILLLDEPLSHLDAPLRRQLRADIVSLHREAGFTTIYVTHDLSDAVNLASHIAIVDAGRVIQTGTLQDLRTAPASPIVTELLKGD
jgi:ABC-type sugar transport system ATPase subunit